MTRILRLLLIAAVVLPLWQPAAAQEVARNAGDKPDVAIEKMIDVGAVAPSASPEMNNATSVVKLPRAIANPKAIAYDK